LHQFSDQGVGVHTDTTQEFAGIAVEKIAYLSKNPLGFFISTMMAGAYVGIAIMLILTLGNEAWVVSSASH